MLNRAGFVYISSIWTLILYLYFLQFCYIFIFTFLSLCDCWNNCNNYERDIYVCDDRYHKSKLKGTRDNQCYCSKWLWSNNTNKFKGRRRFLERISLKSSDFLLAEMSAGLSPCNVIYNVIYWICLNKFSVLSLGQPIPNSLIIVCVTSVRVVYA